MSSEAAAYDFKHVGDFSQGTIFGKDEVDPNSGREEETAPMNYNYGDFHKIDWV